MSEAHQADRWADEGPSRAGLGVKKEEQEEDDFTFDTPCLKKLKTSASCMGQPTRLPPSEAESLRNDLNMNWDLIEVFLCLWESVFVLFFLSGGKCTFTWTV